MQVKINLILLTQLLKNQNYHGHQEGYFDRKKGAKRVRAIETIISEDGH